MPAHNAPLDPDYERSVKANYAEFRRQARESRVGFVIDRSGESALAVDAGRAPSASTRGAGTAAASASRRRTPTCSTNKQANDTAAEFFRAKIRSIVRDPSVADTLAPRDYPLGTKRLCVDTDYYATFNRDNVTLIDLRKSPIEEITPAGVRTRRRRVRGRQPRVRDRIRRDDRAPCSPSTSAGAAGQSLRQNVGGGAAHVSRPRHRRLSESLHHHGAGQPVGAQQHDRVDRAARGLDRRLHRLHAGPRARRHRGHARRAGRLGRRTSTRSAT